MDHVAVEAEIPGPVRMDFRSRVRDNSLQQLMHLLAAEWEAGNPTGRVYSESLAEALALRLMHLSGRQESEPQPKVSPLPGNKLALVKDLVESSLDSELTLESLAREAGYSRSHFLRMFRESTGVTPHQYVIQRRVARAVTLLAENRLGVAQIAAACGFSSQPHMTIAFKKQMGVTPAEYRRSL